MTDRYVEDIKRGAKRYRIIWEMVDRKHPTGASIAVFLMPDGKMIWDGTSLDEDRDQMVRHAKLIIESPRIDFGSIATGSTKRLKG